MPSPKNAIKIVLFLVTLALPSILEAEDADAVRSLVVAPIDQVLISALEIEQTDMDCSHLVHYLYQRSGLDYNYADSTRLYQGVKGFRRVAHPQAGDVVVWRGHVGVVVDPVQHSFISALRTGVKISSYVSPYWKGRGTPRFFHYIAN
ncbi:MAG TPA: NlpC/P60 family protein [Candidatus Angelobacter sp.]